MPVLLQIALHWLSVRFDIITIFPEFFRGPLDYGIVRRAREAALIDVCLHDLRDFTHDRHRTVDDRPFGGGEGMVLKPEPIFEAIESLETESKQPAVVVLLSASGKLFRQEAARRLSSAERVVLICGRYEGVDERVAEHLATEEISIGDFVLSGGELAAALVVDAVTRLLPGALGNEDSSVYESFSSPLAVVSAPIASATSASNRVSRGSVRRQSPRLPALHAPRGIPRLARPGSVARRQSRRNSPLAQKNGPGKNSSQSPRAIPLRHTNHRGPCAAQRIKIQRRSRV